MPPRNRKSTRTDRPEAPPPWSVQPDYVREVVESDVAALLEVPLDSEEIGRAVQRWGATADEVKDFFTAKVQLAQLRLMDAQVRLTMRAVDHLNNVRTGARLTVQGITSLQEAIEGLSLAEGEADYEEGDDGDDGGYEEDDGGDGVPTGPAAEANGEDLTVMEVEDAFAALDEALANGKRSVAPLSERSGKAAGGKKKRSAPKTEVFDAEGNPINA